MDRDGVVNDLVGKAPKSVQKLLLRAFSCEASPRQAIKAMCLECTHYDREVIATCSVSRCPLWEYRPFKA